MSKTMPKFQLCFLLAVSCLFSFYSLMKGNQVGFSSAATVNVAISSSRVTVNFFERGHELSNTQIKITPIGEAALKETNMEEEQKLRSSHRKLISATEHDTLNPQSPLTIPQVTPVPTIVTVPSTNPVSETPLNPTTNPLTVPTATPMTSPPTNPVTTPTLVPPVSNQVPPAITVPMVPPTLVNQSPPTNAIPITTPVMNPVTPPATTNPPSTSGQVWCVAKTGTPPNALQAALDYACGLGGVDCSAIQSTGSCFNPNNLQSHASYAFTNYYQKNPVPSSCDFKGTATLVNTNPSSGSCVYPSSSSTSVATPSITSPPAITPNTLIPPPATPITLSPPVTPITISPPATISSPNEPPVTTSSPPATTSPNLPPFTLNSSYPDSSGPAIYGSPPPGPSSSVSNAASLQPLFAPILLVLLIHTGRLCII